jgi:hypothetical protein
VTARARAILALLLAAWPLLAAASAGAGEPTLPRGVLVVFVPEVSFERLLAHPAVRALAAHGGAGLVPASSDPRRAMQSAFPNESIYPLGGGTTDPRLLMLEQGLGPSAPPLRELDGQLRATVARINVGELLVAVVGERPSQPMRERKDDLLPLVVGRGPPGTVLTEGGQPRAIASDSTRRAGVVVASDLPTTILSFVGHPIAGNPWKAADEGSDIRFVDEPPPFELHARYLAMRRMTVPVQTGAGLYVVIAGLFALAVLRLGPGAPRPLGVLASGAAISVGPAAAALLEAGRLPALSYATVVPFVVLAAALVVGLVLLGAKAVGPLHRILPLGVGLLVVLLVEAALGWGAALTPFLGGSELDGGRFFGLPNAFIGLLLGAALYAASRLSTVWGFAILVAAALFAGLPAAGANLGGAVTVFVAAGLWPPVRARRRFGWREIAFAAAVVLVGTAVVLVAHRFAGTPTHVTRFEEARGIGGAWSTFLDRLDVGVRLIRRNPFAVVPVLGTVVALAVVLRPPASVAPSLERHPAWRDALLVLLAASAVAAVVNDSGPAACGVGFGMAVGGLLYVSVCERTWKMVPA